MNVDLWLDGLKVATTRARANGAKVVLDYSPDVIEQYGDEYLLLSCSLPTPGPSQPGVTWSFLEGLLPEGRALESMAASLRDVALIGGVPSRPKDVILLLAEYGRECAGAVTVLPEGETPDANAHYERLDADGLINALRQLPTHPLGSDPSRGIRMSLAGAQQKFLLARLGGDWYEPLNGAPSTHILKPTVTWPFSAENEALIMNVAKSIGLTTVETWVESIDGRSVLAVERYDRHFEDGIVRRLHQEDLCQALGVRPSKKYEVGRPSERMARLIRLHADSPETALISFLRQIAFRVLVGDEDGHGKNYSLLLNDGRIRLAPLYDSLCTLLYSELSGELATQIGRQRTLQRVNQEALVDEGVAMGLRRDVVVEELARLVAEMRESVSKLDDELTVGWPSGAVVDTVIQRLDQCESGERLGGLVGDPMRNIL